MLPQFNRKFLFRGLFLALLLAVPALASELPEVEDLRADAREARRARLPILVFFSSHGCPYCEVVEEDYLKPMFNGGQYSGKVLFRLVHIDGDGRLRDFDGEMRTQAEFAQRHGVTLTPQVRFFDPDGRELVPALVGLLTRDFYGGYLEASIDEALAKLRPAG